MNPSALIDVRFEIRLAQEREGWTRDAYETIYSGDGIRQIDSFYRSLLRLLAPRGGQSLLDVACGEGTLPILARQIYGVESCGVDLSAAGLRRAQDGSSTDFVAGSGERLPFTGASFDYVTCIGSLEHFIDMQVGVREMARVLRPDGRALILLPNTYSLTNNIYSALKHGRSTIDNQPLQRYAARKEWIWLLEANGLRVLQTFKSERAAPENLNELLYYARHWRDLVRVVMSPLIPLNLATCFVFLCRRADGDIP